jgi:hypothetical protein
MDNNNNRLFIHRDMKPVTLVNSVEIILTPQFYTFIREDLDIRFAYQAKQIAASLFDDYLDHSTEYQYHVNKCQNQWCFFAYNIEEIDQFLETIGIEKHRVSKIYFAQELESALEQPIQLSEKNILQTIDGTVTLIPSQLMERNIQFNPLNIEAEKLTSGITMGASLNSFISLKETILLSSLFFILGTIFIVEGSRTKSSVAKDEALALELTKKHSKYNDSGFRLNLLNKYQPIKKHEITKRQSIKEISKLLSSRSQLVKLTIDKHSIKATIKASDRNVANQVSRNAKAKKLSSSNNGLDVKVEKKI